MIQRGSKLWKLSTCSEKHLLKIAQHKFHDSCGNSENLHVVKTVHQLYGYYNGIIICLIAKMFNKLDKLIKLSFISNSVVAGTC